MKKSMVFLFILLAFGYSLTCQEPKDSVIVNYIYSPQFFDIFTAEESWEIHRAAFIKKMKSQGLTDDEIEKRLNDFEKQREEHLHQVNEHLRIAEFQRQKAEEQMKLAVIQRKKAKELRTLADSQRKKAEELRTLAETQRKMAHKQHAKSASQREKANKSRKQAEIARIKADKQRKLAEIQRVKAEELREKTLAWKKNAEVIISKNITLTDQSNTSESIFFNVNSTAVLQVAIRASISTGTATIEVFNPEGKKEGELTLGVNSALSLQIEEGRRPSTGTLDKTFSAAEIGQWKIVILSKETQGNVAMTVTQYKNPDKDE